MPTTSVESTHKQAVAPESASPDSAKSTELRRTISLPLLVFYGVGVTVGAGIFALVGEIVGLAGGRAPLSFLLAGTIAGLTGLCYCQLIARFPRAGGEAVYATQGLGAVAGRIAGFGVVATGTISSAVIALAFTGYVRDLIAIPESVVAVVLIASLAAIASRGIKESVLFAAAITVLEVGTLLVISVLGFPALFEGNAVSEVISGTAGGPGTSAVFAGAIVAFFAFVGFEDIANMAEETIDARRAGPRAIMITLVITVAVYVLLALIAVSVPERSQLVDSSAPMATLFELLTGRDGRIVSVVAVVAMINGVLVQIVMASRMLYGMAAEQLIPAGLAVVDKRRQTPVRATVLVAFAILVLALFFPLVGLARATSLVTLTVFTLVDLSLFVLARRAMAVDPAFGRWRWFALVAAAAAAGLGIWEATSLL